MADRSQYLQEMVNLVGRLVEDGFSEDEIQEMLTAAMAHLGGPGDIPYARGTCCCPASTNLAENASTIFAGSPPRPRQSRRVAVLHQSGSWGRRIPG